MPKIRNIDKNSVIGANLRNLRQINNLSLQNLGEILDVTYQQVQKYETGVNALPLASLPVLADFFGVSADYFFQGTSDFPAGLDSDDDILSLCLSIAAVPDPMMRYKIRRVVEIMAA
jgi:transcriptional regulator with XRE-family HTH domain